MRRQSCFYTESKSLAGPLKNLLAHRTSRTPLICGSFVTPGKREHASGFDLPRRSSIHIPHPLRYGKRMGKLSGNRERRDRMLVSFVESASEMTRRMRGQNPRGRRLAGMPRRKLGRPRQKNHSAQNSSTPQMKKMTNMEAMKTTTAAKEASEASQVM